MASKHFSLVLPENTPVYVLVGSKLEHLIFEVQPQIVPLLDQLHTMIQISSVCVYGGTWLGARDSPPSMSNTNAIPWLSACGNREEDRSTLFISRIIYLEGGCFFTAPETQSLHSV